MTEVGIADRAIPCLAIDIGASKLTSHSLVTTV